MKCSFSLAVALILAFSLVMAPSLTAQIKQDPKTKLESIEGTIQSIDKKEMTLVIREKGTSNLDYKIVYNEKTIFTYRNSPATMADLKSGLRVVALGKSEGSTKLIAARIDIRDK